MAEAPLIPPDACPQCSAHVKGGKPVAISTGVDRATGRHFTGTEYTATCNNCGAELCALRTDEEAGEQSFFWQLDMHRAQTKGFAQEKREREALLKPLLQAHAERAEVTRSLGLEFTDYSVGSSKRPELRKWLFLDEVNEVVNDSPGILFHMNSMTMTWLFFDSSARLQGYYVRAA